LSPRAGGRFGAAADLSQLARAVVASAVVLGETLRVVRPRPDLAVVAPLDEAVVVVEASTCSEVL
jgi:hypothetical protein